jgi:hypothetical protein
MAGTEVIHRELNAQRFEFGHFFRMGTFHVSSTDSVNSASDAVLCQFPEGMAFRRQQAFAKTGEH